MKLEMSVLRELQVPLVALGQLVPEVEQQGRLEKLALRDHKGQLAPEQEQQGRLEKLALQDHKGQLVQVLLGQHFLLIGTVE